MEVSDFLDVEFISDDIGPTTPRKYYETLLLKLLEEGEGFSGKRPFGNSDWEYDVVAPMIAHGLINGELDDCGCPDEFNWGDVSKAQKQIVSAIFDRPSIGKTQ